MRKQEPEAIKKIASVWDWKDKPSFMANDTSHQRSVNATKGRRINDPLPPNLQIYKEKK